MRAYRKKNPEKFRHADLKKKFNLSLDEYTEMLNFQGGVCKICKKPESGVNHTGRYFNLAVDHCHETGKIRGLLCNKCNRGLGLFQDNLELFKEAVDYLEGA